MIDFILGVIASIVVVVIYTIIYQYIRKVEFGDKLPVTKTNSSETANASLTQFEQQSRIISPSKEREENEIIKEITEE